MQNDMKEEMKMKETLEGEEKLLGVEEEVPLLVWMRTPTSLAVLRWRPVVEREREKEIEDGKPLGRLVFLLSLDLDFSTLGA
jgi:hypothetical protein